MKELIVTLIPILIFIIYAWKLSLQKLPKGFSCQLREQIDKKINIYEIKYPAYAHPFNLEWAIKNQVLSIIKDPLEKPQTVIAKVAKRKRKSFKTALTQFAKQTDRERQAAKKETKND